MISSFDFVIFGGTGDLTMRKLIPSMYHHFCEGLLDCGGRIVGVARSEMDSKKFRNLVNKEAKPHIEEEFIDKAKWAEFLEMLHYVAVDVTTPEGFEALGKVLDEHPDRQRVFYLSIAPHFFAPTVQYLQQFGLNKNGARLAVEKPLGKDLQSAKEINSLMRAVFEEEQIYRIDHYLGKETVQNLMALRFGNSLFEPLWNRSHIKSVQITVAETVGLEGRTYYDGSGALRDMVQNHLMQLLCILAMEPPAENNANFVRDEKLKVLRSLRKIKDREVSEDVVRAQYTSYGDLSGYIEELEAAGVEDAESETETYVAIKAEIDNWRWKGVPFLLRTGKRMRERTTEVVINFRDVPHPIFPTAATVVHEPNRLVLRLQPEEYIKLLMYAKQPGDEFSLRPVKLDLNLNDGLKVRQRSAYERIMIDLLRGDQTLFVRDDELEAAWEWIDPIREAWQKEGSPLYKYKSADWGPTSANELIIKAGSSWFEESGI